MFREAASMFRAAGKGQARRGDAGSAPLHHLGALAMFSPLWTPLGNPRFKELSCKTIA
jgi:hypothetical protein